MSYGNARRGIGMLFAAAILELISAIITGGAIALVLGGDILSSLIAILSFGAVPVLGIIAAILEIVGISVAGRDSGFFKAAFWITILDMIFSVVSVFGFFNLGNIISIFCDISGLLVTLLIILGISAMFRNKGNSKLAGRGIAVVVVFVLTDIVTSAAGAFVAASDSAENPLAPVIVIAAAAVYIVLSIVGYFMYIGYLGKAKNQL